MFVLVFNYIYWFKLVITLSNFPRFRNTRFLYICNPDRLEFLDAPVITTVTTSEGIVSSISVKTVFINIVHMHFPIKINSYSLQHLINSNIIITLKVIGELLYITKDGFD